MLIKYIEMPEDQNDAAFQVITALLGLSSQERVRLQRARERKLARNSVLGSIWGGNE